MYDDHYAFNGVTNTNHDTNHDTSHDTINDTNDTNNYNNCRPRRYLHNGTDMCGQYDVRQRDEWHGSMWL